MTAPRFRFDHAVVFVPDLAAAAAAYARQGMPVRPGGRHQGVPTHNALVPFADGGYLELIAPVRPPLAAVLRGLRRLHLLDRALALRPPLQRRFLRGFGAGGFRDMCLGVEGLEAAVAAARRRGLRVDGPVEMGRVRADGTRVQWRLAIPADPDLPFLIEDVTPRALRVPAPDSRGGELRVERVEGVTLAVEDVGEAARRLGALLGVEAGAEGGDGAAFRVGETPLRLVRRGNEEGGRPSLRLVAAGGPMSAGARLRADGVELVAGGEGGG